MPYEDIIAAVQRRVNNGQGATIEQSRALLELLARYRAGLAEIRILAGDIVLQFWAARPSAPSAVNNICCLQVGLRISSIASRP